MAEPTIEQWAMFWAMGDVNLDGFIDDKDMKLLEESYGSYPGDPNWIGACDLNDDGKIDIEDVGVGAKNYGLNLNIWDYFGIPKPEPLLSWVIPLAGGLIIGAILTAVITFTQ